MDVIRQCGCSGSWSIPHMLLLKVMVWYIVSETCRLQLHSFLTFYLGFDGSDTTGTFIVFCFPAIFFRFYLRFSPFKWHVVGSAISIPVLYTHDSISILETASMEKFSILVKICVDHQPNQGPLEMLISCHKYWKSFETHFVCRF
jgi:hypothetical protein